MSGISPLPTVNVNVWSHGVLRLCQWAAEDGGNNVPSCTIISMKGHCAGLCLLDGVMVGEMFDTLPSETLCLYYSIHALRLTGTHP